MCQRQINRRPTAPKPSNDNEPKTVVRLMTQKSPCLRSGILAVALRRTERVKLDFVAEGVLTIWGERSPRQSLNALQ
jgi:hypothetical protein